MMSSPRTLPLPSPLPTLLSSLLSFLGRSTHAQSFSSPSLDDQQVEDKLAGNGRGAGTWVEAHKGEKWRPKGVGGAAREWEGVWGG